VPQSVQALFIDPRTFEGCNDCPANPYLIEDSETVVNAAVSFVAVAGILLLVGLAVSLRRRWRRSSANQRRALAAVLWTGGIALGIQILNIAIFVLVGDGTQGISVAGLLPFAAVPFAFLFGLLRLRLDRGEAVSTLVSRLGRGEPVRDAIADALGDQTIELAYWLPSRNTYVDAEGAPVELHDCCTPVEQDGRPVAAILHDPGLTEEHELIRSVGAAAGLALENERLDAELRARLMELQASRARIVQATDEERRRLERDLHDGAQQRLVALALNLRLARTKLESDPGTSAELLDEAISNLAHATEELRDFARGIHPAVLTDRGLGAALTVLADRAPLPVEIAEAPDDRLPDPVESAAYYVVAEALTNVAKYAGATHAEVRVERMNGRLEVEVADDGVGGADSSKGSGLRGLADRVGALDGRLEIDSPPGGGTRVRARIPCE
jgi:signal transduction histidine kinase